MPTPTTFSFPSIDDEKLKSESLPANVLNLLEGNPLRPPVYPTLEYSKDTRIIPGGASSAQVIRNNFDNLSETLEALNTKNSVLLNVMNSNKVALDGLNALQSVLSSIESSLLAVTGSAVMLDFYHNSPAILNTSTCNIDTFYGQATLKYLTAPQSHILRPNKSQARPGTVIQYAKLLSSQPTLSAGDFNNGDPNAYFALDGKLDTAWNVPIEFNEDLIVNVKLSPTLGRNMYVNSIGVVPWPTFGTSIIEILIRTNEVNANGGWRSVSLNGQLTYNSVTQVIETAGAHRVIFGGVPVTELIVRLRSKTTKNLGLTLLDCWTLTFDTSSKLELNLAALGISNIKSVGLAGTDPDAVARIIPSILGTQMTLNLTSGSLYDTPVLTAIGLKASTDSTGLTGFDYDQFAV